MLRNMYNIFWKFHLSMKMKNKTKILYRNDSYYQNDILPSFQTHQIGEYLWTIKKNKISWFIMSLLNPFSIRTAKSHKTQAVFEVILYLSHTNVQRLYSAQLARVRVHTHVKKHTAATLISACHCYIDYHSKQCR